MRSRAIIVLFAAFLSFVPTSGYALVNSVLGLERSINAAAERARQTGDYLALSFAEQAMRVLEEWRKANTAIVDAAFDRLDDQTAELFRQLGNTAQLIAEGRNVAFIDMQRLLATSGSMLSRTLFATSEPSVSFSWPMIVTPTGPSRINVRVIGSGLGSAYPSATLGDRQLEINVVTDNEISFMVPREDLRINEREVEPTTITLRYWVQRWSWLPWGLGPGEMRERAIELRRLPDVPARILIDATTEERVRQTRRTEIKLFSARGKNSTYYARVDVPRQDYQEGWRLDERRQMNAPIEQYLGNGRSSCTGWHPNSFRPDYAVMTMQLGSHRGGDAYQHCRARLYLYRYRNVRRQAPQVERQLGWLNDVEIEMPRRIVARTILIETFDGRQYRVREPSDVPYAWFELIMDEERVRFRPKPQNEF